MHPHFLGKQCWGPRLNSTLWAGMLRISSQKLDTLAHELRGSGDPQVQLATLPSVDMGLVRRYRKMLCTVGLRDDWRL